MATYQAELNQYVQVATNAEPNTITAPLSPAEGHWFGVKLKYPFSGFVTNVSGGAFQIEDLDGKGLVSVAEMVFGWEASRWIFLAGAWYRMDTLPTAVPELFDKAVGSTPIGTGTQIPLVYDTSINANPTYFTIVGGDLDCVRPFAGYIETRGYLELALPGNNQDASGRLYLAVQAGTPAINQGYGAVATVAHSRAGTYYFSVFNKAVVVASPGDRIRLAGDDDPTQTGDTFVIEGTGVIATSI